MNLRKTTYGVVNGKDVELFTISDNAGRELVISTLGATVVSVLMPDRSGQLADVVLGYDTPEEYLNDQAYVGCTVGRYANRIEKGEFSLGTKKYKLAVNNGPNHLHGGLKGFNRVVWEAEPFEGEGSAGVTLQYVSKTGEEGYPGTVSVQVTYSLTHKGEWIIDYHATTDGETILNLTNHAYFNLAGHNASNILDHQLMINSRFFTPVDANSIPTGEIRKVDGSPMDFRLAKSIGRDIGKPDEQLHYGNGYDHNWVINKPLGELGLAARVLEPRSGRVLEVWTTQPGVQLYTANFMNVRGKNGAFYRSRQSFCLETQHFPDSPNKPEFPSVVLRPGEEYRHTCIYRFSVQA